MSRHDKIGFLLVGTLLASMSIPATELAALQALYRLSNDALQAIADATLPPKEQATMSHLMTRHSLGGSAALNDEELATLTALVERGDQLMLRKAEAAAILTQRGQAIHK